MTVVPLPARRVRVVTRRRLLAAAVLLVIAGLYVGPVEKYLRVTRAVRSQQAVVAQLERRHAQLVRQGDRLRDPAYLRIVARRCGWIEPGERPLVVEGVPGAAGACG